VWSRNLDLPLNKEPASDIANYSAQRLASVSATAVALALPSTAGSVRRSGFFCAGGVGSPA
jgi:hypothetical protein